MAGKNFRITADGRVFRFARKRYPSGALYLGEYVNGLREGRGSLEYANGNMYFGEWKANEFSGFGVFEWASFVESGKKIVGRRYEGNWEDGMKEGRGIYILGQGDVYEGSFEKDYFSGEGTMRLANGDVSQGNFKKGELDGSASISFRNGDKYEGEFHSGKFQGRGRFVYAHGRGWYEGEYLTGQQHGQGLRVFNNSNRYDGQFVQGDLEGDGIMEYANGDVYIGTWERGNPHGRGVMQFKNGERYEGGFCKGLFYGTGRYTFADGSYYEGEYVRRKGGYAHGVTFPDPDGKRNGRGVRVWSTGDRFEGEWVSDYQHGVGILRKFSGGIFEGRFRWGCKTGPGKETWGNVLSLPFVCPVGNKHEGRGFCTYEGRFADGHFHGAGCFTCHDGRRYEGNWLRGRRHGWGEQVMLADKERGDSRREFIGGIDALYRPVRYTGEWVDGRRTGQGILEFANGMKICGGLVDGLFDGTAKYIFPASSNKADGEEHREERIRLAHFREGTRSRWLLPRHAGIPGVVDDRGTVGSDVQSVLTELLGPIAAAAAAAAEKQRDIQIDEGGDGSW